MLTQPENEELQATNDELELVNGEMNHRTRELDQSNEFLEAILTSMRGGVIVLNRDGNVRVWNRKSEDFWGLRSDEVLSHNFFGLDIGLPVELLKKPFHSVVSGKSDAVKLDLEAHNRRGQMIPLHVTCTPLVGDGNTAGGVIFVVEQRDGGVSHGG